MSEKYIYKKIRFELKCTFKNINEYICILFYVILIQKHSEDHNVDLLQ